MTMPLPKYMSVVTLHILPPVSETTSVFILNITPEQIIAKAVSVASPTPTTAFVLA